MKKRHIKNLFIKYVYFEAKKTNFVSLDFLPALLQNEYDMFFQDREPYIY